MAIWTLKSGSKQDADLSSNAYKAANAGFDVPVNPIIRNANLSPGTANWGMACYEVRINNDLGDSPATDGVSNTNASLDVLNKCYPDESLAGFTTPCHTNRYGSNLENTPGHRIVCSHINGEGAVTEITASNIATNDYFVVIYANDYTKHHIAKITETLTYDEAGDAFEFSPAYPSNIPKDTKFTIYKGPLVSNTNVVAVAYGLKGSGLTADDRHVNIYKLHTPHAYFYNDRLERKNRLNHNTKYKICLSYLTLTSDSSGTGAGTHAQTICVTEPNYGNRIVDYGPFDTPAKLVDNRRESTTYGDVLSEAGGNLQVNDPSKQTKVTISDLSNWDTCFLNIYRSNDNKVLTSSPSGWEGPTRYIHYGTSPDRNNILPTVFDIEISNSITKAGSFAYVEAADTTKILGKKIKRYDRLKFKQMIANGEMSHSKDKTLEGRVWSADDYMTEHNISGSPFSNNELIVENLPKGYNLKVLLQDKATGVYETIRVGDYNYTISSIGNPLDSSTLGANLESIYQIITVDKERLITANAYGTANTNAKNFIGEPLKRKAWSSITNTLLVDFNIDTNVDYDGDGKGTEVSCSFTASGNTVDITSHGYTAGYPITFTTINTTIGISINNTYYVKSSPNTNDFQLVTFSDGSGTAIPLTNNGTGIIKGFNESVDYPSLDTNIRLDYYGNKSEKDIFTSSRIYNLELELKNAEYYNKSLSIKFGDKLHKYVKLQNPRQLMYQDYTQDNSQWPNYLDYYTGPYIINRLVFKGKAETIEDKIENGLMKYKLSGRDDIATLLGPILNKDYKHSEDIVYSTVGPLVLMEDSSGLVNEGSGYDAGQVMIGVDSSGSFEAGDLVFKSNGSFIGRIASVFGDPIISITFEEGILTNLADNDILYVNTSHNLFSFAKSMSSNPFISTTSNLNSASDKGLFFTSGNLIAKSSGIPQTESTSLIGTSSNASSNALGYHLYGSYATSNDTNFASVLSDETDTTSIVKQELHTPSSMTPFDIVSISSGNSDTLIELAPICPSVLARIDDNGYDIRYSDLKDGVLKDADLVDTNITAGDSYNILYATQKTTDNIYSVIGEDGQLTEIGDHLYTADKEYVGKVISKFRDTASDYYIALDEYKTVLSTGAKIYRLNKSDYSGTHTGSSASAYLEDSSAGWINTSKYKLQELVGHTLKNTTDGSSCIITGSTIGGFAYGTLSGGTDNDWDAADEYQIFDTKYKKEQQNIYFLNTQGLDNGGVLHLMNSQFSYAGKPIQFSGNLSDDASGIDGDFIDRYGSFVWKYNDLQLGEPGSISYIEKRFGDNEYKMYYAHESGNAKGSAVAYQYNPGFISSPTINFYRNKYPDTASGSTTGLLEKKSIANRGIYPATGSNFNDSSHHSTSGTGEWDLVPKYGADSSWAYDWVNATQRPLYQGAKLNGINEVKDNWQLIDPKTIRWFIFNKGDLYPDSKTRQNSLLNQTRKLTDYNLFIKNKPSLKPSGQFHKHYKGSLSQQKENDGSYETIDITESDITSNEIKRFGLMRLIEMTFDWHFNSFDPELPPNKDVLLPERKTNHNHSYHKHTEIVTSGETAVSYAGTFPTEITCSGTVSGIAVNDRLYTNKGYFIGKVTIVAGTVVTISSVNYNPLTGEYYTGILYKCNRNTVADAAVENNYYTYPIEGRGTDHTFNNSTITKGMHMLQGGIFSDAQYFNNTNVLINQNTKNSSSGVLTDGAATGSSTINVKGVDPRTVFSVGHELWVDTITLDVGLGDIVSMTATSITVESAPIVLSFGGDRDFKYKGYLKGYSGNLVTDEIDPGDAFGHDDAILNSSGDVATYFNITGSSANLIVTSANLAESLDNDQDLYVNNGKYGLDFGNHFNGKLGLTDYGVSNYKQFGGGLIGSKDNICLPIGGSTVNPGVSTLHSIFDNNYKGAGYSYTDMKHSSRVLGLVGDGTSTDSTRAVWRGIKCVFLGRYSIENKDRYTAAAGMNSSTTSYFYRKLDAKVGGVANVDGSTSIPHSYIFVGTPDISFAKKINKDVPQDNVNTTGRINGDGVYLGFKPILDTSVSTISTIASVNTNLTCKILKFTIATTTQNNQWLNFCPDLTGCYLTSVAGNIYNSSTANGDYMNNSAYNVKPTTIHHVISHTVQYSGTTKIHYIMIDNAVTTHDIYRVMRPAETCFWPKLLNKEGIKLYTLDSQYTKLPTNSSYSNLKGYSDIPSFGYTNDEGKHTTAERIEGSSSTTADYNEGILSMYVVVDPDALSYDGTNSTTKAATSYLVNRKGDYLFDTDAPLNDLFGNSYPVYLNDGNNTFRTDISIQNEGATNSHFISFSGADKMPKLNGIVSVGKIFSVKTIKPVTINNPQTAHIGSTVTIGQEAETLINDIFENNNITFTSSAIDYPYIVAPIFKGVDLYTATDYLANIKKRRIISTINGIKLTKEKDPYDYTNIDITHSNPNINIIEASRSDNTFDFYNEVIVYGKNVKATKKRSDSIKEIGKKTLEEFDNSITTKEEAIRRARHLLHIHTTLNQRYKIKLVANNISLLKPGDVVSVNLPSENIPRSNYIVLENRNSIDGTAELEIGTYDKNMADRLAELFATSKKIDTELRDKQNISTGESVDMNTKVDQKLLKIKIRRAGTTLSLSATGGFPLMGNVPWETVYEEVFVT